MEIALICVSGVHAFVKWRKQIPVGIAGAKVRFQFDDPCWEGLTKTIVFQGAETKDVILDGDSCELPQEGVSRIGASVRVGVYGTDSDNNIAIPTLWAHVGIVQDAADPSGDPATDPSLPIWAQLQQEIKNLKDAGGVNVSGAVPGQMIVVKKVNENGIPTEWEPADRTHWVEDGGMTEIIPETKTNSASSELFELYWVLNQVKVNLEVGKTYTVMYDGSSYECVCQAAPAGLIEDPNAVAMGNFSVVGGANTGEPFAILYSYDYGIVNIVDLAGTANRPVVGIYGKSEIVHKLDNKFLDLDWLPVLEREYILPKTMVKITDDFAEIKQSTGGLFNLPLGSTVNVEINGTVYKATIIDDFEGRYCVDYGAIDSGNDDKLIAGKYFIAQPIRNSSAAFFSTEPGSYTVSVFVEQSSKMPEEYLPESVGGIVVRSSTEGSTKKFHLTIDDNGAVDITEIT